VTPPEWFTAVPGVAYDAIRWGNPNATIALCTLWGRVDHVKDVDTYCMMGNCVSPVGVDFVVRTLLANPQIKVLRVEGPDLSGTKALLHAAVRVTTVSGVPLVVDSYSGDGARVYYLCQRESNIVPVPPPDPGESPTGRGWPPRPGPGWPSFTCAWATAPPRAARAPTPWSWTRETAARCCFCERLKANEKSVTLLRQWPSRMKPMPA